MNAVPARVAGVRRLVMTVPSPGGVLNPLVMAAAKLVRVDEVYRVGGAQAVAALAYGTATIAPVDKITGPGNAYVAAAKRRVFGQVGIEHERFAVGDYRTFAKLSPPLRSEEDRRAVVEAIRAYRAADEALRASRLRLVEASLAILDRVFSLVGIERPARM